ncbi:hypothetical protein [Burkholderia ubonensis]|uniref:hypothetical protein n=1 Tax=Burkholderia ubonensis TaxID=101571 RepID=UPI0009B4D7BF|nr:hypothetical protein [Burkholderia ubonensis]
MPRSLKKIFRPSPVSLHKRSSQHLRMITGVFFVFAVAGCASPVSTADDYRVVIDAGSSGSRAFIYKITSHNPLRVEQVDAGEIESGALSDAISESNSFQKNIVDDVLTSLLDKVKTSPQVEGVPHGRIEVSLLGTGGMRKLEPYQRDAIYGTVQGLIETNGFALGEVGTITGEQEGLFAWLDVNYQDGALDGTKETRGIIEVGGASTQVAFDSPQLGKNANYNLTIDGRNYHVYTKTIAGLGQNDARKLMNKNANSYACYPKGYVRGNDRAGDFNLDDCRIAYGDVFNESVSKEAKEIATVLNDSYRSGTFVGLSGLYHTLRFLKAENNVSRFNLDGQVNHICYRGYAALDAETTHEEKSFLPSQCANSVYATSLLFKALDIRDGSLIALDKIGDNDLTWTLGYVIYRKSQS